MFLERIQKHLRSIFILSLVFTQGLVFIATKAADSDNYNLRATFVEPILGQNIEVGQSLSLEAQLETDDPVDFSTVFFTIENTSGFGGINFEAQGQGANYQSASSWDTSGWQTGTYRVFATAYVYDDEGLLQDTYQSAPGLVNLYSNYQIAANDLPAAGGTVDWLQPNPDLIFPPGEVITGDTMEFQFELPGGTLNLANEPTIRIQPYGDSGSDTTIMTLSIVNDEGVSYGTGPVDISDLEDGFYNAIFEGEINGSSNIGDPAISEPISSHISFKIERSPVFMDLLPDLEIIHPNNGEREVSDNLHIQVAVPETEFASNIFYAVLGDGYDFQAFSIDDVQEFGGNTTYSADMTINPDEYPNGEYPLTFYMSQGGIVDGDKTLLQTPEIIITVANDVEEEPEEEDYTIYLDSPTSGDTVARSFLLNFHTGFVANEIEVTLTSQDGLFTEADTINLPGTYWTWGAELPGTWPAGPSNLSISATHASGTVEENFVLNIEQLDQPIDIDPADVTLNLLQGSQQVSGQVHLNAQANFSGLPVEFFILDASQEEVWQAAGGEVNQQYVVILDTNDLPDGNYEINAKTEVDGTVILASNPYTIQVFNGDNQDGDNQVFFDILDNYRVNESGRIITYNVVSENDFGILVDFDYYDADHNQIPESAEFNGTSFTSLFNADWDTLGRQGISQQNYPQGFYPGRLQVILSSANFSNFEDGKYYLDVSIFGGEANDLLATDEVSFWVRDGYALQYNYSEDTYGIEVRALSQEVFHDDEGGFTYYVVRDDFRFILTSASVSEQNGLTFVLTNDESSEEVEISVPRSSWDEMEELGFSRADAANLRPFVYIKTDIDSKAIPNGMYSVKILEKPDLPIPWRIKVDNTARQEVVVENRVNVNSSRADVAIELYTSCLDVGISDPDACARFRATLDRLDDSCVEEGIYEAMACEDYLARTQVEAECQEEGIVNADECMDYLLEKYSSTVDCQLSDASTCNQVLRESFLNRLVVARNKQDAIDEVVDPLLGQTLTVLDLNQRLLQKGIKDNSLALNPTADKTVYVARSVKETVLEDEDRLTVLNQAVMIIDSDGDGLSDDLEKYYGTRADNKDTDGDGYDDATEIKNGYNPNGEGRLELERTTVDKVILSDNALEQPKVLSKKTDSNFSVKQIENTEGQLSLGGKADANSWVLIYLYSDLPLVMTTKTDASGNWVYDIQDSLTDGHHQVYVTVNDDTGKIVKQSKPISFLVRSAQAVSAEDYFDAAESSDSIRSMTMYYILGAALLVLIALGTIIFVHSRKNNNNINIGPDNGQI